MKKLFEAYAQTYKVKIKHYHADNGRFSDNNFLHAVAKESQTINYCGVNAHFQNGKSENCIRDLQKQTRKKLHHEKSRWPSSVELALWTYELRQATHLINCLPYKEDTSSPLERLSNISVELKLRENLSFG